jgi:hypothetical protein
LLLPRGNARILLMNARRQAEKHGGGYERSSSTDRLPAADRENG